MNLLLPPPPHEIMIIRDHRNSCTVTIKVMCHSYNGNTPILTTLTDCESIMRRARAHFRCELRICRTNELQYKAQALIYLVILCTTRPTLNKLWKTIKSLQNQALLLKE